MNGYKRFDPSRGLDYILDLNLKDLITEKIIQKRYTITKIIFIQLFSNNGNLIIIICNLLM